MDETEENIQELREKVNACCLLAAEVRSYIHENMHRTHQLLVLVQLLENLDWVIWQQPADVV